MIRLFSKYATVGVCNTLIHWLVFYAILHFIELSQESSNSIAFTVAVTFSFFVNAKVIFDVHVSWRRFISYTTFMGALSFLIGGIADVMQLHLLITLIVFSAVSLFIGFLYSHLLVFK